MDLHNLKPAEGSVKSGKRIARGQGSGRGGTSTRGHKGAKSRSGYKSKRAFEGGQMPLQMRLPKRGFNSPNRTEYVGLNLRRLGEVAEKFQLTELNPTTLAEAGVVRKTDKIKILAGGELSTALTITAHAASKAATEAVEKAGGTITIA